MRSAFIFIQRALACLVVLAASGCAHQYAVRAPAAPEIATLDDSFEPYRDRMIQNIPLAEYLEARLSRLTGNLVPIRTGGERGRILGLEAFDENKPLAFGWAVRLTGDGYFLTAAHILNKAPQPLYLVDWSSGKVAARPVRVVWDSWEGIESEDMADLIPADFALIHVPLESSTYTEWAWDWDLRRGVELVAPGGNTFWRAHLAAGHLLKMVTGVEGYGTIKTSGAIGSLVLWHDVHQGHGDSGAPVFLLNGQLVGMTVGGGKTRLPGSRPEPEGNEGSSERVPLALAVRPDPDSLDQMIRNDRLQMAANPNGRRAGLQERGAF